ncbi:DAK2 domain-containing protein [Candidatus Phytoplasma rubi]|uniref:DAK2 domain-containing protein n=1 Tax=Candidatus Phytoplasma rubi TaxID=399025 RepID=A0ABY7BSD7_9MOLU|nr:DAK2 domain-containing protein [Candidatus Phytoplasma rubi]WAN63237.1 DAK2 domain-containing protein [Candidatus Phytoplasma rubi]
MIEYEIIDGDLFKKMIINGAFNLKKNYQKINDLNVFPVPDGDTGTNMQMTMMEGVKKIQLINDSSIITVTKVLAEALLMGSKGNSGVILSQFFSGIHDYIDNLQKNKINVEEFISSLINGYQKAYEAVIEPVEGTILTVLRESIEETVKKKEEIKTIKKAIQITIENAKISLNKTPNLLPILKKSKVVDSGGAGFIFILEGMLLYLDNVELENDDAQDFDLKLNYDIHEISDFKNQYCTEFIIKLNNLDKFDINNYKKQMSCYGDSLILFKNNDLLKIHIHTNNPNDVLKNLLIHGQLIKSKVDDMKKQHSEFISGNKNKEELAKYFIITFVSESEEEEIFDTFKELQSDLVINLNKENFSIENFNKIINKVNAKNIVLFPNESKLIPIMEEACKLNPQLKIKIIPTESIHESYSVLLVFNKTLSFKENLNNIQKNMKKIKLGKIFNLKKESKNLGIFSSIFENKTIESNKDLILLVKNLLKKMISLQNNFLTIFYHKENVFEQNLEKMELFLEKEFPNLEIEKIKNNNNIYPYVFVLE